MLLLLVLRFQKDDFNQVIQLLKSRITGDKDYLVDACKPVLVVFPTWLSFAPRKSNPICDYDEGSLDRVKKRANSPYELENR